MISVGDVVFANILNIAKILGIVSSIFILFGPVSFENEKTDFAISVIYETKFTLFIIVTSILFIDKIVILLRFIFDKYKLFVKIIYTLLKVKQLKLASLGFAALSISFLAAGVLGTGVLQVIFAETRAANYVFKGNYEIIRQRRVEDINASIESGDTSIAIDKLQRFINQPISDYHTGGASRIVSEFSDYQALSKALTRQGERQKKDNLVRTAAYSFRYAYLIDSDNKVAKRHFDNISREASSSKNRTAVQRLIKYCLDRQSNPGKPVTNKAKDDAKLIAPYYTERQDLPLQTLIQMICVRGIYSLDSDKEGDSLSIKVSVKGLKDYNDAIYYFKDLEKSIDLISEID